MARLIIKGEAGEERTVELHLGVNHFGRGPKNEVVIDHPTISTNHCTITLGDNTLHLRDCDSTNGVFVDGEPVAQAELVTGETFFLGDVEIFVESAEVTVAIPQFEIPRPAPPVVKQDGSMLCPRHEGATVTHRCTFCQEVMCDACVHRMRRRGGKVLKLCPLCSHVCEVIGGEKPSKRSFFGFLQKTVKLPFIRNKELR